MILEVAELKRFHNTDSCSQCLAYAAMLVHFAGICLRLLKTCTVEVKSGIPRARLVLTSNNTYKGPSIIENNLVCGRSLPPPDH